MTVEVRVVAIPPSVHLPEGLGELCATLKFVVVREGDTMVVVLGYTTSHYVLALWYALGYDMSAVARHFARPLVVLHSPEMRRIYDCIVGAGRVLVAYQEGQRLPAGDAVTSWKSETLSVDTSEDLRERLGPAVLAHVTAAVDVNQATNPLPMDDD